MAYTTVDNPELFFQAKSWTGTGNEIAITFDGSENMQPDWVWLKRTNASAIHVAHDSVRGATKRLIPNATDAETTQAQYVKSFDSNGITFGTDTDVNTNGAPAILWGWKASGSTASNSNGSITSTVSANTTAGFSIVTWTAGSGVGSIGHGLGVAPSIIIVKGRSAAIGWVTGFKSNGWNNYLTLSGTNGNNDDQRMFSPSGQSDPTSTVWYQDHAALGSSGDTMVGYVFSNVKGYSKFGTYKGNGSSDGPAIFLGFKPAVLLYKNTSQSDEWFIHDNKRQGFNDDNEYLFPSSTQAEGTANRIRFTSNGFKALDSDKGVNASGDVYVYMAFAESPQVNSNGVPNNAR